VIIGDNDSLLATLNTLALESLLFLKAGKQQVLSENNILKFTK